MGKGRNNKKQIDKQLTETTPTVKNNNNKPTPPTNRKKMKTIKAICITVTFFITILTFIFGNDIYSKFYGNRNVDSPVTPPTINVQVNIPENKLIEQPKGIKQKEKNVKKQHISPPPILIRIDTIYGTGKAYNQIDSLWAWNDAEKEAKKDLLRQLNVPDESGISYNIDYSQSYSKRRSPSDDGIYDAKVILFVYWKNKK